MFNSFGSLNFTEINPCYRCFLLLQSVLDVTHIIGCDRFVSYKKDEAIEHTVPRLMP